MKICLISCILSTGLHAQVALEDPVFQGIQPSAGSPSGLPVFEADPGGSSKLAYVPGFATVGSGAPDGNTATVPPFYLDAVSGSIYWHDGTSWEQGENAQALDNRDIANRDRVNHTGAQAISTVSGLQTALDDLETSAELDARDTSNRDRTNHTGVQGISTVTGLQEAIDARETTAQLDARDVANRDRANHSGSQAISTVTGLQTALDDRETTAQLDARDIANRDRANHTGAQAISTVTGLQEAIDARETTAQLDTRDLANRDRTNHTGVQDIATVTGLQTALDDRETTAQLDARDTANRGRSNHTGTQAIATVNGLQADLDLATTHRGRTDNPHNVTSAQLGLGMSDDVAFNSLNLNPVWNDGLTDLVLLDSDVTNTASGAGSLLQRMRVDGTEQFGVGLDGALRIGGTEIVDYDGGTLTVGAPGSSSAVWGNMVVGAADQPLPTFGTTPDGRLDIITSVAAGEAALVLYTKDGTGNKRSKFYLDEATGLYGFDTKWASGGPEFDVARNGVSQFRIDANGNVGIGTVSPGVPLEVDGGNSVSVRVLGDAAGEVELGMDSTGDGLLSLKDLTGTRTVYLRADDNDSYINGGGDFGVGTTTPAARLHVVEGGGSGAVPTSFVAGCVDGDNATAVDFAIYASSTSQGRLMFGDAADEDVAYISYNHSTDSFRFITNASEAMRIDSAGSVGIGTTSPAEDLDVNGTAQATTFQTTGTSTQLQGNVMTSTGNLGDGVNAIGEDAAKNNSGDNNAVFGALALDAGTTSGFNSTFGNSSMSESTAGGHNAVFGYSGLRGATSGGENVAIGSSAGRYINAGTDNTSPDDSIYIGFDTRASAATNVNEIVIGHEGRGSGSNTVTLGNSSITDNYLNGNLHVDGNLRSGAGNTGTGNFVGVDAGNGNSGLAVVAIGQEALFSSHSGNNVVAIGDDSLYSSSTVGTTVAVGSNSLRGAVDGLQNVAVGHNAGRYFGEGSSDVTSPDQSIFIGYDARPETATGDNEIVIGYQGRGNGNDTTTLGNSSTTHTYIAGSWVLDEQGSPPTGAADKAIIFAEDNGTGKTRLMVQFPTGTAVQLAIEP